MRYLLFLAAVTLSCGQSPLLVKPYLQLGDNPADATRMTVVFQTPAAGKFTVTGPTGKPILAREQKIAATSLPEHFVYSAELTGLQPGAEFPYTVSLDGKPLFTAKGVARKSDTQPTRTVIFGDSGQGNAAQREIAWQTAQAKPDMVFIVGDVVYSRGLVSEYRQKLYPVYNADTDTPDAVALMRSRLFTVVPGNHDTVTTDLTKYPDAQAYYLYWNQPRNGPALGNQHQPLLQGDYAATLKASAGSAFPNAANYSFDYGNAHWTMLDGNDYVNWQDPALQQWVAEDLAKASQAAWRFIGFHQPGFNSSKAHFSQQQLRWLAPIFEKGGVDVVFSGHVHNYQRSFPLTFAPTGPGAKKGEVEGTLTLDQAYPDKGQPKGVVYIVTGAGGAGLYNPEQDQDRTTWQPFTKLFVSRTHSLSILDLDGKTLRFRQLDGKGQELDRFEIQK
jgi:predicted phosphodiesterase